MSSTSTKLGFIILFLLFFAINAKATETFELYAGSQNNCIVAKFKHSTTQQGLTGVLHNDGIKCYYHRPVSIGVEQISLSSGTVGTYASGSLVAVHTTNMPGEYQLCLPNAMVATGARFVKLSCSSSPNMLDYSAVITLKDMEYEAGYILNKPILPDHNTANTAGFLLNKAGTLNLTCSSTN